MSSEKALSKNSINPARLQEYVTPLVYEIDLKPNLNTFTYTGIIDITINITKETNNLLIHTEELNLHQASVGGYNHSIKNANIIYGEPVTQLVFLENLKVGKYILNITFDGIINNQMAGFYRSKYTNRNGEDDYLTCTQFEALDARRCFPCWDEPAKKACFILSLVVDDHLDVLSNMPIESKQSIINSKKNKYTFQKTPEMSTYLLAFCIGEFTSESIL